MNLYCMRCGAEMPDEGPCGDACAGWPRVGAVEKPIWWKPYVEQVEAAWPGMVEAYDNGEPSYQIGDGFVDLTPMVAFQAVPEQEKGTVKGAFLSDIARALAQWDRADRSN